MKNITTWIERKISHLIQGYKNYKWNASWVYCGVGGICVLLDMLFHNQNFDDLNDDVSNYVSASNDASDYVGANDDASDGWLSQPYLERVWGWDSHSQNGDLGVLRDFWKFRV